MKFVRNKERSYRARQRSGPIMSGRGNEEHIRFCQGFTRGLLLEAQHAASLDANRRA